MGVEECVVHGVPVRLVSEVNSAQYDALVLVLGGGAGGDGGGAGGEGGGDAGWGAGPPQALEDFIAAARQLDADFDKNVSVLACPRVSGGRLVVSPTGPLTAYDDVRSVGEAALAGVRRAVAAGARRAVLALPAGEGGGGEEWRGAALVALLGALEALYVPLQTRESFPAHASAVTLAALGVYGEGVRAPLARLLADAAALEDARGVARDIGGADPERMTPARAAQYVRALFAASPVRVRVLDAPDELRRRYPLFAAVDRAAASVERHRGCIIFLEYEPENYERTVMLVGKGVTYDTGGCDIKAGGAMAGMSRDKCGAAAVAGFVRLAAVRRAALCVRAALAMVRNSVGELAYVADELLASRAGLAVRVGNTDAEGRLVMADLLAEMAERALHEKEPHLYTVATLTGHAVRAYGLGYTAVVDNHAAREAGHARALAAAGAALGDMLEVSTLRREDLAAHAGRARGDDLHQADSAPSSALPRGHQAPAAFLLLVAGLQRGALRYTHLDVAASAGSLPAPPTAAPLLALAAYYGLVHT